MIAKVWQYNFYCPEFIFTFLEIIPKRNLSEMPKDFVKPASAKYF